MEGKWTKQVISGLDYAFKKILEDEVMRVKLDHKSGLALPMQYCPEDYVDVYGMCVRFPGDVAVGGYVDFIHTSKMEAYEIERLYSKGVNYHKEIAESEVFNHVYKHSIVLELQGVNFEEESDKVIDQIYAFAERKGLVVLNTPIKGKRFFLSYRDVLADKLKELGLFEYFDKLNKVTYYERIKKAFHPVVKLSPANVLFGDIPKGVALVNLEYAEKNGLKTGDKLSMTLKATVIVQPGATGIDIVMHESEDKLKMGAELGNHIYKHKYYCSDFWYSTERASMSQHCYANLNYFNYAYNYEWMKKAVSSKGESLTYQQIIDVFGFYDKSQDLS